MAQEIDAKYKLPGYDQQQQASASNNAGYVPDPPDHIMQMLKDHRDGKIGNVNLWRAIYRALFVQP